MNFYGKFFNIHTKLPVSYMLTHLTFPIGRYGNVALFYSIALKFHNFFPVFRHFDELLIAIRDFKILLPTDGQYSESRKSWAKLR